MGEGRQPCGQNAVNVSQKGGRNKCIGRTVMCEKVCCCKLLGLYTVLSLVVLLENVGFIYCVMVHA